MQRETKRVCREAHQPQSFIGFEQDKQVTLESDEQSESKIDILAT